MKWPSLPGNYGIWLNGQSMPYCIECGEEHAEDARYCSECGHFVGVQNTSPDSAHEESQSAKEVSTNSVPSATEENFLSGDPEGLKHEEYSDVWFHWALAFGGSWAFLAILGLMQGNPFFSSLSLLAFLFCPIFIGIDTRKLPTKLWKSPWYIWVIGGYLLLIIILPIYVYKRHDYIPQANQESESATKIK